MSETEPEAPIRGVSAAHEVFAEDWNDEKKHGVLLGEWTKELYERAVTNEIDADFDKLSVRVDELADHPDPQHDWVRVYLHAPVRRV